MANFLMKAIKCVPKEDKDFNILFGGGTQCIRQNATYGILSCVLTFIVALFVLIFYSIDPLDKDLLINEHAKYLTSKHSFGEVKVISSVSRFLKNYNEDCEREKKEMIGYGNKEDFIEKKAKG